MDREELMKRLEGIGDKDFCRRLNVIDRHGYVTYAGLMMFGKAPEIFEYIPTFCVDYVEIPGSSIERSNVRFAYRIPEQQNIWDAFRVIIRRLRTVVDIPFKMDENGVNVGDTRQFEIVREALVNMLIHSDQFSTLRSCVHVFTDRIEFVNSGAVPVAIEEIRGRCYTNPRNPSLAKFFRFADLCENVGFGIDRIYDWKTLTGKEVTIESMKDRTVVTLMMVPVTDDVRRSDTGQMEKLGEKLGRRLNGNQAKIIGMMIENPYVSIPELSVRVGISTTAVENNISLFKSKGLIRRVGPDKGGHWEVEI